MSKGCADGDTTSPQYCQKCKKIGQTSAMLQEKWSQQAKEVPWEPSHSHLDLLAYGSWLFLCSCCPLSPLSLPRSWYREAISLIEIFEGVMLSTSHMTKLPLVQSNLSLQMTKTQFAI